MPEEPADPRPSASLGTQKNDVPSGVGAHSDTTMSRPPTARYPGPVATIPFDRPVALTTSGAPLLSARSCVICRKRRIRCDKQMPCTNCRKSHSDCMFLTPGRAPHLAEARVRHVSTNVAASDREIHLTKRLRRLEGVVGALQGQSRSNEPILGFDEGGWLEGGHETSARLDDPDDARIPPGVRAVMKAAEEAKEKAAGRNLAGDHQHSGRLVIDAGDQTSRYINDQFWLKLNDELQDLRNELAVGDESDDSEDDMSPDQSPPLDPEAALDHRSFIAGYRSADVDLTAFHPPLEHIDILWEVYLENVEALLKVFHVPTISRLIQQVKVRVDNIQPRDEAVIFAIYYAAVSSMEEGEVQSNLGVSQSDYIARFRFALEQSLAKADFLRSSDIAVLQAFTVFLTMVKLHDESKLCWSLTAVCVRMAQAHGLHQDGTQLGLSPFEVEMRRRLWWAIMTIDMRSTDEMGTDLAATDQSFNTQLPSNIDDVDIDPSYSDPPITRVGRTDTSVCITRYEVCVLQRRLFIAMKNTGPIDPKNMEKSLAEKESMLVEVYDRLEEKFLKHAVMDGDPLLWMASLVARVIMAKISLIIYQPLLFPGGDVKLSSELRSRLWMSTIEIVEYNHMLNTDERGRKWRWLFQTYRQWFAIAYMLLEVSKRPWTATSERAWEAAQVLADDHPMAGVDSEDHIAAWMPIKKLYVKAKRHRETEIARLRADPAAAKLLDSEDRMNPLAQRLGPVPGMESRMSELRMRWRKLCRPEEFAYKTPSLGSIVPDPSRSVTSRAQPGPTLGSVPLEEASRPMESRVNHNPVDAYNSWQPIHLTGDPNATERWDLPGVVPSHSHQVSLMPSTTGMPQRQDFSGGHQAPLEWQVNFDQVGNPEAWMNNADVVDDMFQDGVVLPPHASSDGQFASLDLNIDDVGDIDDIDWKDWQSKLKAVSKPVARGRVSKTGRRG